MLQRHPYCSEVGIEKAYQTAVKKQQIDRVPLQVLAEFDNTVRSMSAAGKILRNSRRTPRVERDKENSEMRASRKQPIKCNQQATNNEKKRRDRLHQLELRKCDLMSQLRRIDEEIASLKASSAIPSCQLVPAERSKKSASGALMNFEPYAPPKEHLVNCLQKGRLVDIIRKHIDLESELRTWKLKIPKEHEQEIFKVLTQRHKLSQSDLVLKFDEFDPFVQADASIPRQTLTNNVYLSYCKCEEHWRNHLQGRFEKEDVKMLFSKLDFDKEGVVGLKQFVRELSILLDRHLRNRDLFRVFMRLAEDGQPFTCTQLLKILARK